MNEITNEPFALRCGDSTPLDWRNQKRLLWVLAAWAACFVGGSQLIKRGLLPEGPLPWLVAALPSVVSVLVLLAYSRFLREADELQRTVQLYALALGFGAGWLVMGGYPLFERLGARAADAGDFTLVMVLAYTVGVLIGRRRYR